MPGLYAIFFFHFLKIWCTLLHSIGTTHKFSLHSPLTIEAYTYTTVGQNTRNNLITKSRTRIAQKNEPFARNNYIFCMLLTIFHCFYPFYKITEKLTQQNSESLQLLFAQVAHDKRAIGAICSFSRANGSFTHKKRAIRSKNRWANSQPWVCRSADYFGNSAGLQDWVKRLKTIDY